MKQAYKNRLWATVIVDELAKNGVDTVCICPGSRNTPLILAFHDHADVTVHSLLDERSAGFFVLGRTMTTGKVTPVVSTSGTATAEFHPAVMEADQCGVPMLVITADRPRELRDSGANQTADQTDLYGRALRYQYDLPHPEANAKTVRSLRVDICKALRKTTGKQPGPAHLNVPFRKPLEPPADSDRVLSEFTENHPLAGNGRPGPFVKWTPPTHQTAEKPNQYDFVEECSRGLIIAGPVPPYQQEPEALIRLAQKTGFPVLADPLSGVRFHPNSETIDMLSGYDGYLGTEFSAIEPAELVLRFGANPTASKPLTDYLGQLESRQILVNPAGNWSEDHFTATDVWETSARVLSEQLETRGDQAVDEDWNEQWIRQEDEWWQTVRESNGDSLFEGTIMREAIEQIPDGGQCFVSNSLPIRDLNQFVEAKQKKLTVLANRGCSGIDGIVSSAIGADSTSEAPLLAVVGDIAFYHDSNGLLALDRLGINTTFLVINNDGGGIFHRLPVKEFDPAFTESIQTPHGLDFEHLAKQYGCNYNQPDTLPDLSSILKEQLATPAPSIIEVQTDPDLR